MLRHRSVIILVAVLLVVADAAAASATTVSPHRSGPIVAWVSRHAVALTSTDPAAPLGDLGPLRRSIDDARVVALGESAHGAAEETTLKHRTLRLLVGQLGFRTIAWEEDWTTGIEIDRYIHGGSESLSRLVATMSPQYQTGEVAGVLKWLRRFNAARRDEVSFVGVEYYFTRRIAYDLVERYVAAVAPQRIDGLRRHLRPLRPRGDDPFEHIDRYSRVKDKQRFLDHAHAVRDLVARIPHRPDDRRHAIALHAATQIVSFYEHYAIPEAENAVYREARAAESLRWWQRLTGDRVVYWAASAHTANAPSLRIVRPDAPDLRFASAGSYLRRWYGHRYLSISFTTDHGSVAGDPGQAVELPPPSPDWFEAPLGHVPFATYILDLRQCHVPVPVRQWLRGPITTRGAGSVIDGGNAAVWFDIVVHTQVVHAAHAV